MIAALFSRIVAPFSKIVALFAKPVPAIVILSVVAGWFFWPSHGQTHVTTTNTVLFDREIVRILDAHCVACHVAEGLASPLVAFEETWLSRDLIRAAVLARHVPPWAAVPGYGEFANDNRLTLRETQFVISWVEGLGPRNAGEVFLNVRDADRAPGAPEAGADVDQWELGVPSLIRALEARVVEPAQEERVERIVLDLGLPSERRVRGIEFRPGDRRVVRGANFFVDGTGQWLGSWTPWHAFMALPEGVTYALAAGARVLAEIYYGTSDERVVDQGRLGLFFSDEPATSPSVSSDLVLEARGEVRAGATLQRFRSETPIVEETRFLSLLPRLDPGIQSLEVSVRRPDGGTEILLFAKDIRLEWPTPYIFREPVVVPRGSVLRATAYYANASDGPQPGGFSLTVSRY